MAKADGKEHSTGSELAGQKIIFMKMYCIICKKLNIKTGLEVKIR